jgi:predicted MFS family arabinose efflux permease
MASWSFLFLLMLANCLNFLDRQVFAILIPAIKADLHLSDTQLGALSGLAFAIFYSILGLPVAKLADRTDRSRVVTIALATWSLMTIACSFAQNFWQLALARILVGVGEAGGTPPSHAMIASRFPSDRQSMAIAVFSLGIPLGILMGMLAGGIAGQAYGWRWAFVIVGVPGIPLALLLHFTVRDSRPQSERGSGPELALRKTVRALWSIEAYRYLLAGAVLFTLSNYGFTQWLPSFLVRSHGLDLKSSGITLGLLLGLVGGAGTLTGGLLVDWLSKRDRRWVFWLPAISILIFVPCFVLALAATAFANFVYLSIIPIYLSFIYVGPAYAMVQRFAHPQQRATAAAFTLFLINLLGLGLGPLSIGAVTDFIVPHFGKESLRYSMMAITSVTSICACISYFRAAHAYKAR